MSDLRSNANKRMFLHTNFFNSSFSAFSALGGLLSWWRGRSGAAGWLWCTDWEQREQLMIAYQKPRFTPSSCFWEWASSTAPQRTVCIWDLTFSNLIKLDEKKPSSAYDPPPTSPWNGMTLKVFLDDIIWKDSESEGTVVSLLQSDAERKRKCTSFFFPFMTWSIEMTVRTCFIRLPWIRLLLGDSCTHK